MKNFLLALLFTFVLCAVLQQFLPWWIIALAAFVVAFFIQQKSSVAFASGFLAVFVLWIALAFFISSANENLLASKVAFLLPLKGNVWTLFLLTGITGGLISGLGALSGSLAAKAKA